MPPDWNEDEKAFAELLDNDTSQTVEWWHRNPELKGWAVALVLPGRQRYFPDFIVKVRGRKRGEGLLLLEVKGEHLLNSSNTAEKALAEHRLYQRSLMVTRESGGRWMTIRHNANHGRNEIDRVFNFDLLAEF